MMTEFILTNRQREYFGLQPLEASWERVPVRDLVLFFDGDVVRKVICYEHSKQYGYSEFDYDLHTQSREQLLPATGRGKSKPLTPGNILARKPLGFSFTCHFGWKGKAFEYQHLYVTHNATGDSIVALDDHGITSYDHLADWVEQFIDSCSPDHLDRIDEQRDKKLVRVRYKPGDAFTIRFDDNTVGYGRILLDIFHLRRTGLFHGVPRCGLGDPVLGSGLLVVIYRHAGQALALDEIPQLPTLSTLLMMHDDIYRGRFQNVGNIPVSKAELDFPEGVIAWHPGDGSTEYHFHKGGMSVALPMTREEYDQVPKIGCSYGLMPRRIGDAIHGGPESLRCIVDDLRFSDLRPEILLRCGLKHNMSYADMVTAKGGITPDEFVRAAKATSVR